MIGKRTNKWDVSLGLQVFVIYNMCVFDGQMSAVEIEIYKVRTSMNTLQGWILDARMIMDYLVKKNARSPKIVRYNKILQYQSRINKMEEYRHEMMLRRLRLNKL